MQESAAYKKWRLHWTEDLHSSFEESLKILGPANATPSKILSLMQKKNPHLNVTLRQVSSHLQQFRINHKLGPSLTRRRFGIQKMKVEFKSPSASISTYSSSSGLASAAPYYQLDTPFQQLTKSSTSIDTVNEEEDYYSSSESPSFATSSIPSSGTPSPDASSTKSVFCPASSFSSSSSAVVSFYFDETPSSTHSPSLLPLDISICGAVSSACPSEFSHSKFCTVQALYSITSEEDQQFPPFM